MTIETFLLFLLLLLSAFSSLQAEDTTGSPRGQSDVDSIVNEFLDAAEMRLTDIHYKNQRSQWEFNVDMLPDKRHAAVQAAEAEAVRRGRRRRRRRSCCCCWFRCEGERRS